MIRDHRFEQNGMEFKEKNNLPGLFSPLLESYGNDLEHVFCTRLGGVSRGIYESLNFSIVRGDEREAVIENYHRLSQLFGVTTMDIVTTYQTHTTNIRKATREDGGKGIVIPKDYVDVDGLITDEKQLVLGVFMADCVPIFFYDPVRKVIGAAHSGWRGTVGRIGAKMIHLFESEYGSKPEDIICVVGPSICVACYEVSEDVAMQFQEAFPDQESMPKICHPGKKQGKYQLDLWMANYRMLLECGVQRDHIQITDICTCHNPELLFSHRAMGENRGNLGAFIMLK